MAKKSPSKKQLQEALRRYAKNQEKHTLRLIRHGEYDNDRIFDEDGRKEVERIYRDYIKDKIDNSKPFRYADYPHLKQQLEELQKMMQLAMYNNIVTAISKEWRDSNLNVDKLVKTAFPNTPNNILTQYLQHNENAQKAFINRKIATGRTLKGRTWLLSKRYLRDVEDTLTLGIKNGDSAENIGKRLTEYLDKPEVKADHIEKLTDPKYKDHFNVRQTQEKVRTTKTQYNSSKKHAKMLAANETNLAYRNAETERIQQLDFVVGYEILLSNAHPKYDICDEVNGKYPKWFIWNGWHPNCFCYRILILKTPEEMAKDSVKILRGEPVSNGSVNLVNDVPEGFKQWVSDNYDRASRWRNKPYFMQDNNIAKIMGKEAMNSLTHINKIKAQSNYVDNTSNKIASSVGASVTPINLKSNNRIFEKAKQDYLGDVTKVKDIVRNTFIAPEAKHQTLLSEIGKSFSIDRVKLQESATNRLGYSGTLINIKLPKGGFGEVQINSASMIYGKDVSSKDILKTRLYDRIAKQSGLEAGLGHKYYEEWRKLDRSNPIQRNRMIQIEKLSKEYYDKLRKLGI